MANLFKTPRTSDYRTIPTQNTDSAKIGEIEIKLTKSGIVPEPKAALRQEMKFQRHNESWICIWNSEAFGIGKHMK